MQIIIDHSQIDLLIEYFTNLICNVHGLSVPLKTPNHYKIILPDIILNKIKQRNLIRKQWKRNRRCLYLKSWYNALANEIKNDIKKSRNTAGQSNLSKMNKDKNNDRLWKFVKIMKSDCKIIPPLRSDDNVYLTDKEKCEAIKTNLKKAHNITHSQKSSIENQVNQTVHAFKARQLLVPNTDPTEKHSS